jgi:acyl transferase domain-containing protein/NADPH:quinone reductase-like Zn-dependent oxidoreductase/acyl carrier protein
MSIQTPASTHPESIAVIGIGCRFPGGASSPEAFWTLLVDGVDTVTEVPEDRWDLRAFYHPDPAQPGKIYTRYGSFLQDVDLFDAGFFRISPREAACIDPQQRLLLETAWEALEDAGQVPQRLAGTATGVWVGLSTSDYVAVRRLNTRSLDSHSAVSGALSIASNRISYAFDLRGPSMTVDTACSSSLVAVHLACESLLRGESTLALAGGAALMFDPTVTMFHCKARILSARGRCRSFDAEADGFARAEGVAMIALKPLSAALADGDPVYAVIRSTAVNQDGRTYGLSLPNPQAQADLLRQAYARAGIPLGAVQYVEAHGTGTPVGDPIECEALGKALGAGRPAGDCLRIGSVKSNIGHAEAAAGVVGLIKVVLALRHSYIPASLHFRTPNPAIPFEALRLRVQEQGEPWPKTSGPTVAGVNSFGFGGTSVHAVLEEFVPPPATTPLAAPSSRARLLPISARSPEALRGYAQAYLDFLNEDPPLNDVCHTASLRREHHPHRLALVGETGAELRESLEAFLVGERRPGLSASERPAGEVPKVAFMFCGNGPQWWAMGRQLLAEEPVFRQAVEICDALLCQHATWSMLEELQADETSTRMARTDIAQPALFAVQVGLVALWRSWGIAPAAVVGHSVGEVAAAYVAGALSLEDAVRVIFHRSRTQQRTAGSGGMAAVGLPAADAREALAAYGDRLCVAGVNSPESVTVSGDAGALDLLLASLEEQKVFCRRLPLDYAFHSPHMEPVREDLLESLEGLAAHPATTCRFYSTVTGGELAGPELGAAYWWDNIRRPVEFSSAVAGLVEDGCTTFLEIGPHPALRLYVAECLRDQGKDGSVLASLRREEEERATLLGSLGALYTLGCTPGWTALDPEGGRWVRLPSYPWQRERHWQEIGPSDLRLWDRPVHPLLGYRLESADTIFQAQLHTWLLPYLEAHQVQGAAIFPAAGYVEMALAAANLHGDGPWTIEGLEIRKPLLLNGPQAPVVQVSLSSEDNVLHVRSRADHGQGWVLHATGQARKFPHPNGLRNFDLEEIRARCTREVSKTAIYELADRLGVHYGPSFRGVARAWVGKDEALGEIHVPDALDIEDPEYVLHPVALDACLQTGYAAQVGENGEPSLHVPVEIARLRVYRRAGKRLFCHTRIVERGFNSLKIDYRIADEDQELVAEVLGLQTRALDPQGARATALENQLYEERWLSKSLPAGGRRRSARDLPSPSSLADLERVMPHYGELSDELGRARYYQELKPQINALTSAYVSHALRQLGWDPWPGERVAAAALSEQLGVQPQHERLMAWFLRMLEEQGVLRRVEDAFYVQCVPDEVDPAPLWRELSRRYPAHQSEFLLLARCGTRLAQVLTGQVDPLEILFGEPTAATLEHLYESSATARMYNGLMQAVVAGIVDSLPNDRALRVLEIGAGTGGATTSLLPELPADRTEYVFTDISEAFLHKAEQKYRKYPFVRYQLLDIEKDPAVQGFEEHSFDLVIASNVVHATADLRCTLGNVQRLLASEGLLALTEVTNPSRSVFVVFGLLPGFWLFADEDLRPNQALMPQDRWIGLLEEVGFTEVTALTEQQAAPDQSILLARGPRVKQAGTPVECPSQVTRSWLVLADQAGVAGQVGRLFTTRGDRVLFVEKGNGFEQYAHDRFRMDPRSAGDMTQLFETLRSEQVMVTDVVGCWSLDTPADRLTASFLAQAHMSSCSSVVHLIQQLEGSGGKAPRLWLVTSGALAPHPGQNFVSVAQSSLVGLRRVLFNEHPELRCTLVDIGPATTCDGSALRYRVEELEELCAELCTDDQEDEVAIRGRGRYVNRLARMSPDVASAPPDGAKGEPGSYQLQISTPGVLDSLSLRPVRRRRPRAGEVEIEVHAAGLNFKDIMHAMGLLAPIVEAGSAGRLYLGGECAGRIVAVGDGVTDLRVGDDAIAMGRDALSAYLTTAAGIVVRKPPELSFEESTTLLTTFLTAHYALHHLAKLRKGERVLIHVASGGVGLAAIQIVRAAGGEVFATAGNPEKREYLRLLGIEHVMDSRSVAFAEEIIEITGGEGVDIVLNSLTGEGLAKSLDSLRRFGRFLEIGKRDFLDNRRLGLRPFERCLSLHAIDMEQVMFADPALTKSLLADVMARVHDGTYRPLPHRTFPVSRSVEAFRYMQQARHIGKVVVSMRERHVPVALLAPRGEFALRSDSTYLISGGLGGFGLATARWMVERGAHHLVLAGRRGAASPEAQETVAALREAGAHVLVAQTDVSQEEQVRELVAIIRVSLPPLRGVVHAAMVLADSTVLQLDEELLATVMAPKVLGTWNLHEQTLDEPLDFFVLFSSVASVVGNAGQGNYAAANTFLDNFAAFRVAQGLPALTVNWGAIADVGYVAQEAGVGEQLLRKGIRTISPEVALEAMGRLLQEGRVRAAVADLDWQAVARTMDSPRWADLRSGIGKGGPSGEQVEGFRQRLLDASAEERVELVTACLSGHLAAVLGTSAAMMNPERPLADMGMDSLVATELRIRLEKDLGVDIQVAQMMQATTLAALVAYLVERVTEGEPVPAGA